MIQAMNNDVAVLLPSRSELPVNAQSGQSYTSDAQIPNENRRWSGHKPIWTQLDFGFCRCKLSGFGDYVDCLVDDPYPCEHALRFAFGYLCLHPEHKRIIAQTEAGNGEEQFATTSLLQSRPTC
jgi:hypothetical protein